MGYNITIGCAELVGEWDPGYGEAPSAKWVVKTIGAWGSEDAPDGGDCNERSPSYSGWSNFAEAVGIHAIFFDKEDGLMREHPGTQRLTAEHLTAFVAALNDYRKEHPSERAGMCKCRECVHWITDADKAPPHDPTLNYNLLRLEWLVKWTRYALTTERPGIENM